MEQIIQIVVNNGLGVASFIALLYFMNKYLTQIKNTNEEIAQTLVSVKDSLEDLRNRVDKIEKKSKIKKEEIE